MALEFRDRVADTTATTGTGTVTLDGSAPAGYRDFTAYMTGATVRYSIATFDGAEWEVGQGVWTTSGATLTRVTVYASSNAGALVDFSAGSKLVQAVPVAADFIRPAFRAHRGSSQTGLTANSYQKVALTSVGFDTIGAFDATTNYRYTPTVAGYYSFTGQVAGAGAARLFANIYKNGTVASGGSDNATGYRSIVSDILYLNGSTDYVELWVYTSATSILSGGTSDIYFAGALVAAAA